MSPDMESITHHDHVDEGQLNAFYDYNYANDKHVSH